MAAVRVDPRIAHEGIRGEQEVGGVAVGLETQDVVGQQPLADRAAQCLGQHLPGLDGRPRDVVEMQQQGIWACLPDGRRSEIQVIVLEQHDGPRPRPRSRCRGPAQLLVDHAVAVLPGVDQALVHPWLIGQLVQLVLKEPEEGVGDDVVVSPVGIVADLHEAQRKVLPGQFRGDDLAQGSAVVSLSGQDLPRGPVRGVHGGTHPGDRREAPHLGQRGHQAT